MVSKFLQGRTSVKGEDIVDLIYHHPEGVPKAARSLSLIGMSTVPYTATAVLLTVTIRSQAVPYINCIDELETPRRYSTVITTAGIRLVTAVWDGEKS